MALTRQKKEEIIKNITDGIKNAASVAFVKFHRLSVADANEIRRGLRESNVQYSVVKKTLLKRALLNLGISGEMPGLEGEIAVAYSADMVLPAKTISLFQKKFKEAIDLLGGILESRYLTQQEIKALAATPSRQTLLAQLVMVMYSPVTQTVRTLNEVNRSFVGVLHQIAEAKH